MSRKDSGLFCFWIYQQHMQASPFSLRPSPGQPGPDARSLTIRTGFKRLRLYRYRTLTCDTRVGGATRKQLVGERNPTGLRREFETPFPRHSTSAFKKAHGVARGMCAESACGMAIIASTGGEQHWRLHCAVTATSSGHTGFDSLATHQFCRNNSTGRVPA